MFWSAVLVSDGCCSNLPQTQWLKTKQISSVVVLEVGIFKYSDRALIPLLCAFPSFQRLPASLGSHPLPAIPLFQSLLPSSPPLLLLRDSCFPSDKDSCDHFGSIQIIQDNLPIPQTLTTSAKPKRQEAVSGIICRGFGDWDSAIFGDNYSAHHECLPRAGVCSWSRRWQVWLEHGKRDGRRCSQRRGCMA